MLVSGRSHAALCISVIAFLFVPAIVKWQDVAPPPAWRAEARSANAGALTCDRTLIDRASYEMSTIGQAQALQPTQALRSTANPQA